MVGADEEYGQEIEMVFVKEQLVPFDQSERLVNMTGNQTASGVVSAILQVVLELKTWAEFFTKTEFQDSQPLS